jgi:hypothetical protein
VCAAPDCEVQFRQRARGSKRLYCSRLCRDRVDQRARRAAGFVPVHKRDDTPRCKVKGCESARFSLGYCPMHHARVQKSGDPGEATPRKARKGQGQWHPNGQGYIVRNRNGTKELQHRVVMAEQLGRELYPDENPHHRNGDRATTGQRTWSCGRPGSRPVSGLRRRWLGLGSYWPGMSLRATELEGMTHGSQG